MTVPSLSEYAEALLVRLEEAGRDSGETIEVHTADLRAVVALARSLFEAYCSSWESAMGEDL